MAMTEVEIRAELNQVKQKIDTLAKEFAVINSQITIRKIELNAEGVSAKPKSTTDPKLIRLLARAQELNEELNGLHKRRKELNKMVPPKVKQKKPRGDRPKNRVYMGSEFRDCTGYERRLALLMAYEIGQERYTELFFHSFNATKNCVVVVDSNINSFARFFAKLLKIV